MEFWAGFGAWSCCLRQMQHLALLGLSLDPTRGNPLGHELSVPWLFLDSLRFRVLSRHSLGGWVGVAAPGGHHERRHLSRVCPLLREQSQQSDIFQDLQGNQASLLPAEDSDEAILLFL